jgi:hypothetical protein
LVPAIFCPTGGLARSFPASNADFPALRQRPFLAQRRAKSSRFRRFFFDTLKFWLYSTNPAGHARSGTNEPPAFTDAEESIIDHPAN